MGVAFNVIDFRKFFAESRSCRGCRTIAIGLNSLTISQRNYFQNCGRFWGIEAHLEKNRLRTTVVGVESQPQMVKSVAPAAG